MAKWAKAIIIMNKSQYQQRTKRRAEKRSISQLNFSHLREIFMKFVIVSTVIDCTDIVQSSDCRCLLYFGQKERHHKDEIMVDVAVFFI